MAVGKPTIGAINGSCSNFIKNNNIGNVCNPEDSNALANIIKTLDIKELTLIGKHTKSVYFDKYNKSIFIDRLVSTLGKTYKKHI